ncbi:unnamed protein product [Oreochromis niloticus]|nr:unnamed protein product [Mustela putorius furo]
MAAAALSRTRGPAIANKGLLLIFSMLCLVSVAGSLYTQDQMMLEQMKILIKEAERWKAEDRYRKETTTKLFDLSSSLTHKDQLELFQETLRSAVKQEETAGDKYKMAATVLDKLFEKYIHQSELDMLADYPPVKEVIKVGLHFMKNFRTYMDKKMTLLQE